MANPDVQAAVTSSVMHVGRMTDKSHKELLAELLAKKISQDEETDNYLLNEAIEIASSIDANQIKFTAFSLALVRLGPAFNPAIYIPDESKKLAFRHFYTESVPKFIDNDSKPLDVFYLSYKGVTAAAGGLVRYTTPVLELIANNTGISFDNFKSDEELTGSDFFSKLFPKLSLILRGYGFKSVEDFNSSPLSQIGFIIGEAYLRNKGVLQG